MVLRLFGHCYIYLSSSEVLKFDKSNLKTNFISHCKILHAKFSILMRRWLLRLELNDEASEEWTLCQIQWKRFTVSLIRVVQVLF